MENRRGERVEIDGQGAGRIRGPGIHLSAGRVRRKQARPCLRDGGPSCPQSSRIKERRGQAIGTPPDGGNPGAGNGALVGDRQCGFWRQPLGRNVVDVGKSRQKIDISALGSRLSALGSRLSALGSRLSALGSRLSALGSRLSALGSRLSALGSRLSALGSRLSALGSRLSALGSRLSALGSRLSALGSRLSALGSRLSALGSRLSALGSRLSALGSRLSALGSRLSALGLQATVPSFSPMSRLLACSSLRGWIVSSPWPHPVRAPLRNYPQAVPPVRS